MSIFVSCGEVSGDLYAADFIRELLKQRPDLAGNIWGVMGPRGTAAGGTALWSYDELKIMGFAEVLPALPRLLRLRAAIVREVMRRSPEAVVVIDTPDFHFLLVKKLRKLGYKGLCVFLVTPTVWAWRSGRCQLLKEYFDLSFPLFSFEHEFLLKHGVNSEWSAHPLVASIAGHRTPAELTERFRGRRVIAMMAGSRNYDIRHHTTTLVETARLLRSDGLTPVFSVAPGLPQQLKDELLAQLSGFDSWDGDGRDVMEIAEAVVGVSGTVAVEAMLMRRFMIVIYTAHWLTWTIARMMVRIPYVSIPNYLTDAPVYPELLKNDMRPELIRSELHKYLDDPLHKAEVDRRLELARKAMGTACAAEFWASRVLHRLS